MAACNLQKLLKTTTNENMRVSYVISLEAIYKTNKITIITSLNTSKEEKGFINKECQHIKTSDNNKKR